MKKQQYQHRRSSVLAILRYLNGIKRANRSMNACDNIMSGRKREVATINPTGNFDLFLTATAAESRMLAEATSLKNMEIEARLKDQKIIAF